MPETAELMFDMSDNIPESLEKLEEFDELVSDVFDKIDDFEGEFAADNIEEVTKYLDDARDVADGLNEASSVLEGHFDTSQENIQGMEDALGEVDEELKELMDKQEEFIEAGAKGNIELQEKLSQQLNQQFDQLQDAYSKSTDQLQQEGEEIAGMFEEEGIDIGENIREGLAPENLGQTMGSTFGKIAKGDLSGVANNLAAQTEDMVGSMGGMMEEAAGGMAAEGKLLEGGAGGPSAASFGGMKSMMGKLGKVAGKFALFAGSLGVITGIVSELVEAVSTAKKLNAEMAQQASYAEMAASEHGNAVEAMRDIRKVATSNELIGRFGVDPEESRKILGTLHEEGVQLEKLTEQYGNRREGAKESIKGIVAASKNLAVQNQETAKFAATMMEKHSRTMPQVREDLGVITERAIAADMAASDFFGTIQKTSSQLSLYNYNLGETTELLEKTSQFMDPENAKEFTKNMTTGLKEMSSQERLRTMALNDQADIRDKIRQAAGRNLKQLKDETGSFAEAMTILEDRTGKSVNNIEDMKSALGGMGTQQRREVLLEVREDAGKEAYDKMEKASGLLRDASGSALDVQEGMAELGALDSMDLQISALENALGKPLESMNAVVTKQFGINRDQLEKMKRMNTVTEGGYNALQNAMKNSGEDQKKAVEKVAKRLGIQATVNKEGQLINKNTEKAIKDEMDVLKAMEDERRKEIKDQEKQLSAAEKQVRETKSISRFLQANLTDWLNRIATGVLNIERAIYKLTPLGSEFRTEMMQNLKSLNQKSSKMQNLEEKAAKLEESGKGKKAEEVRKRVKKLKEEIKTQKKVRDLMKKNKGQLKDVPSLGGGREDMKNLIKAYAKKGPKGATFDEYKKQARSKMSHGKGFMGAVGASLGRLSEVFLGGTGSGKSDKAIAKETAQNMKKAQEKTQEQLAGAITDGEIKSVEELKKQWKKVMGNKGFQVEEDSMKKAVGKGVMKAHKKLMLIEKLVKAGMDRGDAATAAGAMQAAGSKKGAVKSVENALGKDFGAKDAVRSVWESSLKKKSTPTTKDAYMMQSGIPLLDLQKGDVIVDREELGSAARGGEGSFAGKVGGAGKGGGGGSGSRNLYATININGGNTDKIEKKVLSILDMWERGGVE